MERNVKYTSIGVALLLMVVGLVVFVLWLGRADIGSSKSYHILTTDDVSSLGVNTPVKFKGISIGKVSDVRFEDFEKGVVRVSLSLDPKLRVLEDSYMSVGSGGLAGASYLVFNQGESERENTSGVLELRKGGLDSLLDSMGSLGEKASNIVEKTSDIVQNISEMTNEQSTQNVQDILQNISSISANMDKMFARMDSVMSALDRNFQEGQYDLKAIANPTMIQLQEALGEMNGFFYRANRLLDKLDKSPYDSIFGKRKESKE